MKQLNWYQIFGKSNIPDGRTVEPTDDIQIWLHCANIWDKTYTTLNEVLDDTDTLSALIASENAVDYMVRSTTWAVTITVPAMTGYTTPSGKAFSSGNPTSHECWQAFSGKVTQDGTDNWEKSFSSGDYIGYTFTQAVCVHLIKLTNPMWGEVPKARCIRDFKLQGSNDENTWTDIASYTNEKVLEKLFAVSNTDSYTSYRLYITSNYGNQYVLVDDLQFYSLSITSDSTAMTLIGANNYCANTLLADATWCEAIGNSPYIESVINVKVPKMTSNTTPSGVCSASTVSGSNYAYMAFDEVVGNVWMATSGTNQSVTYKFTESKLIKLVTLQVLIDSAAARVKNFKVQGSNDGVTYTDIKSCVYENNHNLQAFELSENETSYQYLRVYVTDNYNTSLYISITALQFYGREDV